MRQIVVTLLVLVAAGCASSPALVKAPTKIDGVAPDAAQAARSATPSKVRAVEAFDRNRDEGQWQAVLADLDKGNLESCRQGATSLVERNPTHAQALLVLAELNLADGQPAQALEQANQVLGHDPNNARALHVKGLALEATHEADAALAFFERASNLKPDSEVYRLSYSTAVEARNRAVQAPVTSGSLSTIAAAANAGAALPATLTEPADLSAAEGTAGSRSRAPKPICANHPVPAGSIEELLSVPESANDDAGAAAHPESSENPIQNALAASQSGDGTRATSILKAELARSPGSAALHRVLGLVYYQQGNYSSAAASFREALSLDNSNAASYFLMGCTLARLGDDRAAQHHYRQACTLDPRYRDTPIGSL